jgi:hypothetical protein
MTLTLFSLMISTTLHASITQESLEIQATETTTKVPYSLMSTEELQKEVERLSQKEELPFEMGLELIERWGGRL